MIRTALRSSSLSVRSLNRMNTITSIRLCSNESPNSADLAISAASRAIAQHKVGSPDWKAAMTVLVGDAQVEAYKGRTARIYQPAPNVMQQMGGWKAVWRLEVEPSKTWKNPLMGWTTSSDPFATLKNLEFKTVEDALEFANYYGIECTVIPANKPKKVGKAYASNFKWKGPAQ